MSHKKRSPLLDLLYLWQDWLADSDKLPLQEDHARGVVGGSMHHTWIWGIVEARPPYGPAMLPGSRNILGFQDSRTASLYAAQNGGVIVPCLVSVVLANAHREKRGITVLTEDFGLMDVDPAIMVADEEIPF